MAASDNRWQLFGLDLGSLATMWKAGWREIAWSQDSLLRRLLDDAVSVRELGAAHPQIYQAGRITQLQSAPCNACVLPDDLLLIKQLALPESVEADIESALGFEIRANSPFPPEDICSGWLVCGRGDGRIMVKLVIVSRSAVNNYLRTHGILKDDALEIWALVDQDPVVISGFGESYRNRRYEKKLKRIVATAAYCLLMLMLIPAVPVLAKQQELNKLERMFQRVQVDAQEAVQLRASLAASNERADMLNRLLSVRQDPHVQLQTLTELLGDDVWLASFELRENRLRIDGRAANAAGLMQSLSEQPAFVEVRSPAAIRRERTGEERFVLDITLRSEEGL